MRILLLAALTIALLTGSAEAFTASGVGQDSCGTWSQVRQARSAALYEQWVLGFLSAVGDAADSWGIHPPTDPPDPNNFDPLNQLDNAAVMAWIDNYCRDHPLDHIFIAGERFVAAHPH